MKSREELKSGIARLLELKGECQMQVMDAYQLSELSLKQIGYLKKFAMAGGITTSQLADLLDLSKPSVTAMVKKFIRMGYVYKEDCRMDGRVHFLKLTDKGQRVTNLDQLTIDTMVVKLQDQLENRDLEALIDILGKLESIR